jgi:hypothetical protein
MADVIPFPPTGSGGLDPAQENKLNSLPNAWQATTAYAVGDQISNSSKVYQCVTPHTSGGSFVQIPNWIDITEGGETLSEAPAYEYEVWPIIGQSNATDSGTAAGYDEALDGPVEGVYEFSRGTTKSNQTVAPSGQIMKHQLPSQNGNILDGISFDRHFAAARRKANPKIKKLVIINRAVGGSGFSNNHWNQGNTTYTDFVDDINSFLGKYPEYHMPGIIWHQGEQDALGGTTEAAHQTNLTNMETGFSQDISGYSDDTIFIAGTLSEDWITQADATRRPVDDAIRNVSAYITNSSFIDLSDQNGVVTDEIHFDTPAKRIMGQRYAKEAQKVLRNIRVSPYQPAWIKVENGVAVDKWGNHNIHDAVDVFVDGTRGDVITTVNNAFRTDIKLRRDQYTKALWFKQTGFVLNTGNILSSGFTGFSADAYYFSIRGSAHGFQPNVGSTSNYELPNDIDTWRHVILTFDGTNFRTYVNGSLVHTGTENNSVLPENQGIIIGGALHGNPPSSDAEYHLDDIVVLPRWINDSQATDLYNMFNT